MTERVRIQETRFHTFGGEFPEVETFPHVNTALLYEGDEKPFHIVLPICEIGRTSNNGLVYDEELVHSIAEQLKQGVGGGRGHIKDEDVDTAFPVEVVNWIGARLVDNKLWGKAYVAQGETREDLRRKKATGGGVGTSIWGDAIKETINTPGKGRKTWKARQFILEELDLAPTKRAALSMGGAFAVVGEMTDLEAQENLTMPDNIREITTPADVPQTVREMIVKEAQIQADAARVAEFKTQVAELQTQLSAIEPDKALVAELKTVFGDEPIVAKTIAEMRTTISELGKLLGDDPLARVKEMRTQVEEFARKAFEGAVESKVTELTAWDARTDDGKKKVAAFRSNLRSRLIAELGSERDGTKIAETAQKLWDAEYQPLSEMVVAALAGPSAIVGGKPQGNKPTLPTADEIAAARAKTGI